MAKQPTPAALRRKQQARVKDIVKHYEGHDPFGGLGDWDPSGAPKTAIARVIAHLAGLKIPKPKPIAQKPQPVKRSVKKKKSPPPPKKGKKVAKANEVCLKSPFTGEPQWMPLVAELSELLAEGWTIVDGDMSVQQAYLFLNVNPEELQSA